MNIKNKLIIVTGGSRGIGKKICELLLSNNYLVISISRKKSLNSIRHKNYKIFYCDISSDVAIHNLFKKIEKKYGKLYGLINNAGINPSRENIVNTAYKDFRNTMFTNIFGAFNCSKYFIQNLIKYNTKGTLINISSVAGLVGMQKRTSYAISKSAMIGLTKSIVSDYSIKGIRAFCVCPAYIVTDLTKPFINNLNKKKKEILIKSHKLGRLGKTEDVANLIIFLLDKDKSSWMTGNIIQVDGGYIT